MVYGLLDGYYKVMSNIPKMGQLPTPVFLVTTEKKHGFHTHFSSIQIFIHQGYVSWNIEFTNYRLNSIGVPVVSMSYFLGTSIPHFYTSATNFP